ncbi:uncharacterized protein HGUI_01933 [Hanseniaspora guilliermondii]|uniref:Sodium/calcium exchanger membrane region domain-containing protein n=1 Tax=Hanseniaspora guilliermondii TaxID=56406 RepID=A0A1L0CLH1_9ASCO|nr:uncharacterized protein HGUI_01933 [Hanseniaspora guilliermondii]
MITSTSITEKLINGGIYDDASYWAIPLSILQLLSVFFLMGAISEDFLALNVNLLCNSSNLLISVLMAFCNSSPDLISNFVAWYSSAKPQKGSESDITNTADTLAISEVLGACGTIMFMAVGFILLAFNKLFKGILTKRFHQQNINKRYQDVNQLNVPLEAHVTTTNESIEGKIYQFINEVNTPEYTDDLKRLLIPLLNKLSNDMIFFALGFSLILMSCQIEKVSIFVCISLLALYVMFMLNSIRHHKKHSNDMIDYENALADQIELENTADFNLDNQEEADIIFKRKTDENNFFLDNDNLSFLASMFNNDELQETTDEQDDVWGETRNIWNDDDVGDVLKLTKPHQQGSDRISNLKTHSLSFAYSDNPSEPSQMVENPIMYDKVSKEGISEKLKDNIFFVFFKKKLKSFYSYNILKKIVFLITEPVFLIAIIVCPRYNKVIPKERDLFLALTLQCFTSIFFMVWVFSTFLKRNFIWIDIILTFLIGFAIMGVQFRMRKKYMKLSEFSLNRPLTSRISQDNTLATSETINNTLRYEQLIDESTLFQEFRVECCIFSIIGIVNSIFWIVILSNNLIQIIEFYQKTFHISETILGMTLFAWGNSVPDILTNVAVLKLYANELPKGLDKNPTLLYKWQVQSLLKYCHISIVTCISSSTINSMIGIGFNALVAILKKRPFQIYWSLKDISNKTRIHLMLTSSSVLVYVMIVALVLKLLVKKSQILERFLIDGYFNKRNVVLADSDEEDQENATNYFKLEHTKVLKFLSIYVISIWLFINFINVLIEILL